MAPGRTEAHGAHSAPPAARTHSRRSAAPLAPPGRTLTFPSPDSAPRALALLVALGTHFSLCQRVSAWSFGPGTPPPKQLLFNASKLPLLDLWLLCRRKGWGYVGCVECPSTP